VVIPWVIPPFTPAQPPFAGKGGRRGPDFRNLSRRRGGKTMRNARFWLGLAVATMAVALVLSVTSIWLITSRPVAVAEAIDGGSITPLVQAVTAALGELWGALRQWL